MDARGGKEKGVLRSEVAQKTEVHGGSNEVQDPAQVDAVQGFADRLARDGNVRVNGLWHPAQGIEYG